MRSMSRKQWPWQQYTTFPMLPTQMELPPLSLRCGILAGSRKGCPPGFTRNPASSARSRRASRHQANSNMRILGIDPGLQATGFGVVDIDGQQLRYVASGPIRTPSLALGDMLAGLKILFDGI